MRINKYIAQSGLCSRRKADELIANGNVRVNAAVLREHGYDVQEGDRVEVNGHLIAAEAGSVYVLINKPLGMVTTVSDDKERLTVSRGQKEIVLSQSEYHLLLLLMENKGKTITRNQLLEQIWDNHGHFVNNNTLTVTVKRLREKLCNPTCLKTVRSFGYRMEDTI